MRLLTVLVIALSLSATSTARAEDRTWQGVFVGSTTLALVGGGLLWYGLDRVDHAEKRLCTGSYETDCPNTPPTSEAEINDLNDQGERGSTMAWVGAGAAVVGVGAAAYSAYRAFYVKDSKDDTLAIAPVITREGGGAAVMLRW